MYQFFINHYSKNYLIKSKYINHIYNISDHDQYQAQLKIQKQIAYLQDTYIDNQFDDGRLSLLDFSYAANLRPDRYISELLNRVNTLKKYALSHGYSQPIFLTITPQPEFKPLKVVRLPKKHYDLMVDNPVFTGDFWNYTDDCRVDIGNAFSKLQRDRIFRDIKSEFGHTPIYFSSWEPYIDGSLHKHIMLFIPPKFRERFLNRISYHLRDRMHDVKFVYGDDNIENSIRYILKYIIKTFTHSKTDEISLETLFYIKHGLRRFTTSRTLAPLFLYRLQRKEEDYFSFTRSFHAGDIIWEGIRRECGTMKPTSIVSIVNPYQTQSLYYLPDRGASLN